MKRLFGIAVLFLLLVPRIHADGADDQYVQIYNLIQQGDTAGASHPDEALAKYTEAQNSLLRFQKVYPGWNQKVVNFRLNYLASKITIITAAADSNTSASNAPVVTATPPVTTPPSVATTPPPVTQPAPAKLPTPAPQPAAPAVVTTPPVQAPPPAAPVVTPPPVVSPNVELLKQIADLQNQLRQVQNDKMLVEAKLREALAAHPAGADPQQYAQAQEKIRSMEKEN
ncbi:MAG TPA: hypothetical protein VG938_12455, partial [Verrucomicrobiae bacterium]|nr:hypothetical protein [Verrucomicrobiae bacterium]